MEVFEVCKVLLNCIDKAFLVNIVADRVVAGYCTEIQLVAWYQGSVAIGVEMDLFIGFYFDGCESFPTQGSLSRKEVGLDIDLSSAQDVQLLLSVNLGKHLLGGVDLPDEFVSNSYLEFLSPMAKEEDTRLD